MTKKQFLARCANAWDAGFCTDDRLKLLERWLDMVMRFEGGQVNIFLEEMERERKRLHGMYSSDVLANDKDGYALIQFAAILTHHCQKCAVDPQAWWTRPGFCEHQKQRNCGDDGE
jgi:hypothetical protein